MKVYIVLHVTCSFLFRACGKYWCYSSNEWWCDGNSSSSQCCLKTAEVEGRTRTSALRSPKCLTKAAFPLKTPHFIQMPNVGTVLFQVTHWTSPTKPFLLTELKHCQDWSLSPDTLWSRRNKTPIQMSTFSLAARCFESGPESAFWWSDKLKRGGTDVI